MVAQGRPVVAGRGRERSAAPTSSTRSSPPAAPREGATTVAFAALDDQPPVTLSEDGSGATFVTLAARADEAVAMYIDARRMLTPVHARVLKAGPEARARRRRGPLRGRRHRRADPGRARAGEPGHELVLLPIDKDEKGFGLAAIRVEDKPRDDAAVTWSLDPPALERRRRRGDAGSWPIRVLRVRAAGAEAGGKKVLELGEVDAAGGFEGALPGGGGRDLQRPGDARRPGRRAVDRVHGRGRYVDREARAIASV